MIINEGSQTFTLQLIRSRELAGSLGLVRACFCCDFLDPVFLWKQRSVSKLTGSEDNEEVRQDIKVSASHE